METVLHVNVILIIPCKKVYPKKNLNVHLPE